MTLTNQLITLESSGLIQIAQVEPDLEYLFRHALVQDAAYESLLKQDRRVLHRAVGEALEQLYPERLGDLAPLLGDHFAEAGDDERALHYFTLAGDNSLKRYAIIEAIGQYERAKQIALSRNAKTDQLIYLFTRQGRAYELSSQYPKALDTYQALAALADQRQSDQMKLAALMGMATVYNTPNDMGNPQLGRQICEQALALARPHGDRAAEARILWLLLLNWRFIDLPVAAQYGEQSLTIARDLNLREQMAYTLNDLATLYLFSGHLKKAETYSTEARALWRELGNINMLADNLANSVGMSCFKGNFDQAIAASNEAYAISASIGNAWGQAHSRTTVEIAYFERGDIDQTIRMLEETHELGRQSHLRSSEFNAIISLARIYGQLGVTQPGYAWLAEATEELVRVMPRWIAWTVTVHGMLLYMDGKFDEAEAKLREIEQEMRPPRVISTPADAFWPITMGELALRKQDYAQAMALMDGDLADGSHSDIHLIMPPALHVKARALLGLGQIDAAYDALQAARAEAESMLARWSLWPILFTLSQLEAQRGHQAEAARLWQQARDLISYIADHISNPELHSSFLALPDVRAVMERQPL